MVQGLAADGTGEETCLSLGLAFGSCTAACGSSLAFDATRSRGATVLLLLPTPETCQQQREFQKNADRQSRQTAAQCM